MESKETLESQVSGLETKIQELTNELSTARHDLGVIGKPTMTENVYELLQNTISKAIEDLKFAVDDFDYEMTIGCDNKVELDMIYFKHKEDLIHDIIIYIDKEFRVIENEENPNYMGEGITIITNPNDKE